MPSTPRKPPSRAAAKAPARRATAAPAAKPAAPQPLKPAAKAAAQAAKPAAKADGKKEKKPKLVRDSFTIPKAEYAVIEALKQRAAKAGAPARKSEVLRAGIKTLAGLSDEAFLAAMAMVPSLKTGRPAKS